METDQTPAAPEPKTSRYIGIGILVVFLILILFLGTRAWFMGSHRAECILNARNVQQAVRSDFGMNARNPSDPIDWNDIFGPGKMHDKKPKCPAGGTYTFSKFYPEIGKLALTCSHPDHVPPNHHNW